MKRWISLVALALLSACAAPPEQCIRYIECPDGLEDCHQQARNFCPTGYSQMSDADVGSDFSDFAKQHFAGASAGVPHIVAQCRP